MFIFTHYTILNSNDISRIDCDSLYQDGSIHIYLKSGRDYKVYNIAESLNIIMKVCPSYLEGKSGKYMKRAWMIHNLIGHPLMQIFSFFGMKKLAFRIHDSTIPRPKDVIK